MSPPTQQPPKTRLGSGCNLLPQGDGRFAVVLNPAFKSGDRRMRTDGEYFGQGRFIVDRRADGDLVRSRPAEDDAAAEEAALIGVTVRSVVWYYLQEARIAVPSGSGLVFDGIGGNAPTVGGAFPGVILWSDYTDIGSLDPATNALDAARGWPLASYAAAPYYPPGGFWVNGVAGPLVDSPGSPGFADLPPNRVSAVGAMFTLALTTGGNDYEWDIVPVTVREYKYNNYSWAEWENL